MSNSCFRPAKVARRGLTLIELVVVMLILAALAGVILPMLPSMVTRAHTSSSATNLGEIAKAIQTYEQVYFGYPNNLDSLVDASGNYLNYVIGARPGDSTADLGGPTPTALTLTDDHVEALKKAGITTMAQMVGATVGGDFNPTFYPYGADAAVAPTSTTLATGVAIAQVSGVAAARELGGPAGATYALFGLGRYSSMQGKTMQEAPVHFSDEKGAGPNKAYARYGVVFQLTDGDGEALERARFAGVVALHDHGIATIGEHIAEYFATAE